MQRRAHKTCGRLFQKTWFVQLFILNARVANTECIILESSQKSGHVSDINRRAAFAMSNVDFGRQELAVICEIINLPPPLSDLNF